MLDILSIKEKITLRTFSSQALMQYHMVDYVSTARKKTRKL